MIKRSILLASLLLSSGAFAADTPNPVTPGYQICSNASGSTICGFQPVDTSHGLPVVQEAPSPGQYIGNVGGFDNSITVTPTVAASSHVSGSSVGGLQTLAFFRASSPFTGIYNNTLAVWKTGTNLTAVTVYGFSANPTGSTCTDATAVSIAAADVSKLIPGTPFTMMPAVIGAGSTFSAAYVQSPITVKNNDSTRGQNLYFCIAVNATITPAANDFVFTVAGPQD